MTARLLLSPSAVEGIPVLQDSQLLDPSGFKFFWILQDFIYFWKFSRGELLLESALCWTPH